MTEEDYQKERAAALERSKATDAHAHTLPEYWQLVEEELRNARATIVRLRSQVRTLRRENAALAAV